MDANRGRGRSVPAAGVLCAVLFLGGGLLIGDLAGSFADSDPQFVDVHESAGNRVRFIVGGYALSASAIAFIWFAVGLSQRLGTRTNQAIVSTARISAAVFAAVLLVSAASFMTVAASITFGELFDDRGQFATGKSTLPQLGYVLFNLAGTLAGASTIVAFSMLIKGARRSDKLIRRGGYVAAALLPLSGVMSLFLVLLPIWIIATSLTLGRRPPTASVRK